MTDTATRVLTIGDVIALANIIRYAQGERRVVRIMPDGGPNAGEILRGTARSIGNDRGNFLATGEDVRDAYLRVTLDTGWEAFWLIGELIGENSEGYFTEDLR